MASDLVLYCLSMSHIKDARLKWVKSVQNLNTLCKFRNGGFRLGDDSHAYLHAIYVESAGV